MKNVIMKIIVKCNEWNNNNSNGNNNESINNGIMILIMICVWKWLMCNINVYVCVYVYVCSNEKKSSIINKIVVMKIMKIIIICINV